MRVTPSQAQGFPATLARPPRLPGRLPGPGRPPGTGQARQPAPARAGVMTGPAKTSSSRKET